MTQILPDNLCDLFLESNRLYRYRRHIMFSMNSDNVVIGIVTNDDNDMTTYKEKQIFVEKRTIPEVLRGHPQKLISFLELPSHEKLEILSSLENRHTDHGDTIIQYDNRIIIHAPHK
jgi:hypothetical protein